MIPSLASSWRRLRPPGDPDHLFICLSSQCFTCQWKVQASGRLLSLYFCILLINHSFHIMFRLQIRGETLTLRQILSYLTSTWTFSIQNSRFFFYYYYYYSCWVLLNFPLQSSQSTFFFMSLIWVSFCVLIKLNLLWKAISKQNRCYSFLSTAHFLFFKDQTIDLTDFFSPPERSVWTTSRCEFVCAHGFTETVFKPQALRLIMKFVP